MALCGLAHVAERKSTSNWRLGVKTRLGGWGQSTFVTRTGPAQGRAPSLQSALTPVSLHHAVDPAGHAAESFRDEASGTERAEFGLASRSARVAPGGVVAVGGPRRAPIARRGLACVSPSPRRYPRSCLCARPRAGSPRLRQRSRRARRAR